MESADDLKLLRERVCDLEKTIEQLRGDRFRKHLKYTRDHDDERPSFTYQCSARYAPCSWGEYTDMYVVEDKERLWLMTKFGRYATKVPIKYCPFCCKHPLFDI
jgi:hypothetical protein